ncbi:MAG TPA: hypothetical protein VF184_11565 [Phycisphaeraceae bacterium]
MNLRVGPYLYRVRFVHGYIEHEGQPCLGLCDNDQHELLISDQISEAQQIQVIGHEYMEAWLYHFGQNLKDKEDYCDLFGIAMAQLVMDLVHQMRLDASELLKPPTDAKSPPPPPAEAAPPPEIAAPPETATPAAIAASSQAATPPAATASPLAASAAPAQSPQAGPVPPAALAVRMIERYEPGESGTGRRWRLRILEPLTTDPPAPAV